MQARGKYVVVQGAPMVPLEERRSLRLGKLSELGLRAASTQVLQLKRLSGRVTIILIDQKGNANKLARMVASKHNGDVYQVSVHNRVYSYFWVILLSYNRAKIYDSLKF